MSNSYIYILVYEAQKHLLYGNNQMSQQKFNFCIMYFNDRLLKIASQIRISDVGEQNNI